MYQRRRHCQARRTQYCLLLWDFSEMASILIIASYPILREALRQFLFPEHRTVARDRWSAAADLQHHDLVIVDREALDDTDEFLRVLQRLKIPSVWLHQGPAPSLRPARLTATVAMPLEGPSLEAAVRSLLSMTSGPETGSEAPPPSDEPSVAEPEASPPRDGEIIELTEVVEEPDDEEPDDET